MYIFLYGNSTISCTLLPHYTTKSSRHIPNNMGDRSVFHKVEMITHAPTHTLPLPIMAVAVLWLGSYGHLPFPLLVCSVGSVCWSAFTTTQSVTRKHMQCVHTPL